MRLEPCDRGRGMSPCRPTTLAASSGARTSRPEFGPDPLSPEPSFSQELVKDTGIVGTLDDQCEAANRVSLRSLYSNMTLPASRANTAASTGPRAEFDRSIFPPSTAISSLLISIWPMIALCSDPTHRVPGIAFIGSAILVIMIGMTAVSPPSTDQTPGQLAGHQASPGTVFRIG